MIVDHKGDIGIKLLLFHVVKKGMDQRMKRKFTKVQSTGIKFS